MYRPRDIFTRRELFMALATTIKEFLLALPAARVDLYKTQTILSR